MDIYELIHNRYLDLGELLHGYDKDDRIYRYIKDKRKSYKSIMNKLGMISIESNSN